MQRVRSERIVGFSALNLMPLQAVSLRNGSRRGSQGGEEDGILTFLQYKVATYVRRCLLFRVPFDHSPAGTDTRASLSDVPRLQILL